MLEETERGLKFIIFKLTTVFSFVFKDYLFLKLYILKGEVYFEFFRKH